MDEESEFTCLSCNGKDFKPVPTRVTLTKKSGEVIAIEDLVDLQCTNCGEIRSQGPLLPRVEAEIRSNF